MRSDPWIVLVAIFAECWKIEQTAAEVYHGANIDIRVPKSTGRVKEDGDRAEVIQRLASPEPSDAKRGSDLGVPQLLEPYPNEVLEAIQGARDYVEDFVLRDEAYVPVRKLCKNMHESCGLWASQGECEVNPDFMKSQCAPFCKSCKQLHLDALCAAGPDDPNAWAPGDLTNTFERITSDPAMQQYEPIVLSQPDYVDSDSDEDYDNVDQQGPWVVLLERFLTQEETERMIEMGTEQGYSRSKQFGARLANGTRDNLVTSSRTSANTWCKDSCVEDATIQNVLRKLHYVTGLSDENAEYLQLLKYDVGQYYRTHTDYTPSHKKQNMGVRILTVFLYLNEVDEGGGTNFPHLNLTVMPKRGRALIWPSVLDEAPNNVDKRCEHQALPVIKGQKYAANAWYHQKNYKKAHAQGCG